MVHHRNYPLFLTFVILNVTLTLVLPSTQNIRLLMYLPCLNLLRPTMDEEVHL